MSIRECPGLVVVVNDYLVRISRLDYCVRSGVAWLEFVRAGEGPYHDLLADLEW